jgi:hypothetical protein
LCWQHWWVSFLASINELLFFWVSMILLHESFLSAAQ